VKKKDAHVEIRAVARPFQQGQLQLQSKKMDANAEICASAPEFHWKPARLESKRKDGHAKITAVVSDLQQGLSRKRVTLQRPHKLSGAKCAECKQFDLCEYDESDGQSYCRRCWAEYMADRGDIAVEVADKRVCSSNCVSDASNAQAAGTGCAASKQQPRQMPAFASAAHLRTLLDAPAQAPQSAASSSSAAAHLGTLLDVPAQAPQSAASLSSAPKATAASREVSKGEPLRLEEAIASEVSKLNSQIDLLEGKLQSADEEFERTKLERDVQVADLKAELAGKTRELEDQISELNAKIVQAMADKKQTEENLQSIRDRSRCQIEDLPVANKARKLEISRNALREELDKLLLKRAEVNSWRAGNQR